MERLNSFNDGATWRPKDEKGNEVLPIIYEGRTYLLLRVTANAFNIPAAYVGAKKTIQLGQIDGITFQLKIQV